MKRVLRTTMMALLVMMLLVGMMAPAAMAAYEPVYTAEIPVSIFMDTSPEAGLEVPETDSIDVTVVPITEGSPAATESSFVINCVGGDTKKGVGSFKAGPFDKPGLHSYHVTLGTSKQVFALEDTEKHFIVDVYVVNNADYTGLTTEVRYYNAEVGENGDLVMGTKCTGLEDINLYCPPMTITVSKRWPDGGSRPITVMLYEIVGADENERTEIDKITLDSASDWQHTFYGLDSRKDYVLDEVDLAKFHESYKYDKTDDLNWYVTITNTRSLYQTGQLNWPIPFLVCFGAMFMLAGVILLRKKEEQTNE